jgi:hypothetical protein
MLGATAAEARVIVSIAIRRAERASGKGLLAALQPQAYTMVSCELL